MSRSCRSPADRSGTSWASTRVSPTRGIPSGRSSRSAWTTRRNGRPTSLPRRPRRSWVRFRTCPPPEGGGHVCLPGSSSTLIARLLLPEGAMSTFEPAYLALHRSGELEERARRGIALLGPERCVVCPRECKVDRLADRPGLCRVGRHAVVASHFAPFGEENCLRG